MFNRNLESRLKRNLQIKIKKNFEIKFKRNLETMIEDVVSYSGPFWKLISRFFFHNKIYYNRFNFLMFLLAS